MVKSLSLLFSLLVICFLANSQTLVVPPGPGDLSAATHLGQSDDYIVEVKKSGDAPYTTCFVYKTDNWASNHFGNERRVQESVSFTNFSFNNTSVDVKITVIKPGLTASSVTIRPLNYEITPVRNGNVITFTLTTPRKISVEVNNRLNPLFLFADQPDVVPHPASVAQYYGPGVHNIGLHKQINSGETVYIAGGAVLQGTFYIPSGSNGITVRGRGIISGGLLPTASERAGGGVNFTPSIDSIQKYAVFTGKKDKYGSTIHYNLNFEGFTMVNTCGTHFAMVNTNHQNHDNTFHNLKEVDWSVNTDNVFDGDNNIVDDCFFFNNDDCIVTRASNNLRITNLTYWGGQCGRLMWHQNYGSSDGVFFDNIHVIGHDGEQYVLKFTPHAVYGEMKNFTFKNIRIEEHPYGGLRVQPNNYMTNKFISINGVKNGIGTLKVSNWLFENVTVDDQNANEGAFTANATATIDVTFKNLKMGGSYISSLKEGHMTANQYCDIKFEVGPSLEKLKH